MDRILITDLSARANIGVKDEERRQKQEVLINLALSVDLRQAGRHDRIEETVDYSALKHRVLDVVEHSEYRLAEALAEAIAGICLEDPAVAQVQVRVEKPTALRFARNVGVEITRERARPSQRAFIGVGSNVHPEENVAQALHMLARQARVVRLSTVYRTEAEGRPEQPPYLNCVVEVETALSPVELKEAVLRPIEHALGRERSADKYAPRTIDLDLIAYGGSTPQADGLFLPDPQVLGRPFVAIPLQELAPELVPAAAGPSGRVVAAPAPDGMQPLEGFTERLRRGLRYDEQAGEGSARDL